MGSTEGHYAVIISGSQSPALLPSFAPAIATSVVHISTIKFNGHESRIGIIIVMENCRYSAQNLESVSRSRIARNVAHVTRTQLLRAARFLASPSPGQ